MNLTEILLLKRGFGVVASSPSIDEVLSLMNVVEAENGMDGPPDLDLEFVTNGESVNSIHAELRLMLAFHRTKSPQWLVHFRIPKSRRSMVLASRPHFHDDFEVRTCCGVLSMYRVECLLNNGEIIHKAIEWFLEHHNACPSLIWTGYFDAVRDANNS